MTSAKVGANHVPKGVVAVVLVKNSFYAMFLADLVPVAPIEDLSLILDPPNSVHQPAKIKMNTTSLKSNHSTNSSIDLAD